MNAELTGREADILGLLAEGMTIAGMARKLAMSDSTVKTHMAHLYHKLDVHNAHGAVGFAYETGLLRPDCSVRQTRWWLLDRLGDRVTYARSREEADRQSLTNSGRVARVQPESRWVTAWEAGE